YAPPRHGAHMAYEPTRVVGLGNPVIWCLTSTGRCDGGWVGREFQMAKDLADHLTLRDDSDESQHPARTKRAVRQVQAKAPLEQLRPAPARRPGACLRLVAALLPGRREDRPAQPSARRQTATIAYQVDMRQGDQGRQFLQEFERREGDAR